ncbi:MAG: alcohol dehydrogenase catalytic domain-containing protein [Ardenticatenaceae bacterium]|nr:alcohol dehydrogenase catalytic domain-containing protein [Ardenticatenaceae bacterium]
MATNDLPKTMRAMVLEEWSAPLLLREVPVPEIGPRDALVRVRACGVCYTDIKISNHVFGWTSVPHILGHEPAGEVAAVGREVHNVSVGDHVAVAMYRGCGECEYCRTQRPNLCAKLQRVGFEVDGGYAEYLRVPADRLFPVAEHVPFEEIALLGDCITTAWHAVTRRAEVGVGDVVMVIGVGGLGIHAVQIVRLTGGRVIAVDLVGEKLEAARQFGAEWTINPGREDVVARVNAITGGGGIDFVIDFVGNPESVATGFDALRPGGSIVMVGYSPDKKVAVPALGLVLGEKKLIGSRVSSKVEMMKLIDLIERRQIAPVISARFPLEQANEALALLKTGKILGRAVLVP